MSRLATVGPEWWAADIGGRRLVGVGALFGSGLTAEAAQQAWLESEVRAVPTTGSLWSSTSQSPSARLS